MLRRVVVLVATCLLAAAAAAQTLPPPAPGPTPAPAPQPKAVKGTITELSVQKGKLLVVIDKGANDGVATGWKGQLMKGRTALPVAGVSLVVTKVSADECVADVSGASAQVIERNKRVVLRP